MAKVKRDKIILSSEEKQVIELADKMQSVIPEGTCNAIVMSACLTLLGTMCMEWDEPIMKRRMVLHNLVEDMIKKR